MLDQGVYLAPSGYEVAFLSAAHGDEALAAFEKAVAAVAPSFGEGRA
jgi:glutamate-1-semialdehyde 2,1-aminomutase